VWYLPQAENWHPEYEQINRRARLHVCSLPPDQLNPAGCYDGSQAAMLQVCRCDWGLAFSQVARMSPAQFPTCVQPSTVCLLVGRLHCLHRCGRSLRDDLRCVVLAAAA